MIGLLKHIYTCFDGFIRKCVRNREYRTYLLMVIKFNRCSRYTPCKVTINGLNISVPDVASFLSAYKEIFVDKIYDFHFAGDQPVILDLGANIGISILFFKNQYPKAKIIAFEADPMIYSYLYDNIYKNGLNDVELVNKAAWVVDTKLSFCQEGADGGRVASTGDKNLVEVDAVNMTQYLSGKKIDFLKMDIEGAEELVLPACRKHLSGISRIFVEYHSHADRKQCLDQLLAILTESGFRLHVHSVMSSSSPFTEIRVSDGFDLQLNIFGSRVE